MNTDEQFTVSTDKDETVVQDQDKAFPTVLLDELLDNCCLEAGATPAELEQEKVIAQIEALLVARGRSIKDVYQEWETSTSEQIIARYSHLLQMPMEGNPPLPHSATDWFTARFVTLTQQGEGCATFHVLPDEAIRSTPVREIQVSVGTTLLERVKSLPAGASVKLRLNVDYDQGRLTASLLDLKPIDN